MSDGFFIDINGLDNLSNKIETIVIDMKNIENSSLQKAGKCINDEIINNAPVSLTPRQPKKKTQLWRSGKHAKELLKVSNVKRKNGRKYVEAGLQKNDNSKAFYLKFFEYGSSKLPATNFMSKAYESKKDEATNIIKQEIRNALNLR